MGLDINNLAGDNLPAFFLALAFAFIIIGIGAWAIVELGNAGGGTTFSDYWDKTGNFLYPKSTQDSLMIQNDLVLSNAGVFGYLGFKNLTEDRYYELPDKNGTIATLDDIIAGSSSCEQVGEACQFEIEGSGSNSILNGSFEDSDEEGLLYWDIGNDINGGISNDSYEGEYAVQFFDHEDILDGLIYQELELTQDTNYELYFYAKGDIESELGVLVLVYDDENVYFVDLNEDYAGLVQGGEMSEVLENGDFEDLNNGFFTGWSPLIMGEGNASVSVETCSEKGNCALLSTDSFTGAAISSDYYEVDNHTNIEISCERIGNNYYQDKVSLIIGGNNGNNIYDFENSEWTEWGDFDTNYITVFDITANWATFYKEIMIDNINNVSIMVAVFGDELIDYNVYIDNCSIEQGSFNLSSIELQYINLEGSGYNEYEMSWFSLDKNYNAYIMFFGNEVLLDSVTLDSGEAESKYIDGVLINNICVPKKSCLTTGTYTEYYTFEQETFLDLFNLNPDGNLISVRNDEYGMILDSEGKLEVECIKLRNDDDWVCGSSSSGDVNLDNYVTSSELSNSLSDFVPYSGGNQDLVLNHRIESNALRTNAIGIGIDADPINFQLKMHNSGTANTLISTDTGYATTRFMRNGELLAYFGIGSLFNDDFQIATYNSIGGKGGNGIGFFTDSILRFKINANGTTKLYGDLELNCLKFANNPSKVMCAAPEERDDEFELNDTNFYLYVSKSGNDVGNCELGSPCETIGRALEVAINYTFANIYINIDNGVYDEYINITNRFNNNYLFIEGQMDGEDINTIIQHSGDYCLSAYRSNLYLNNLMFKDCNVGLYAYSSYIDTENIGFENNDIGLKITDSTLYISRGDSYAYNNGYNGNRGLHIQDSSTFRNYGEFGIEGFDIGGYAYNSSMIDNTNDSNMEVLVNLSGSHGFYLSNYSAIKNFGTINIDGNTIDENNFNIGIELNNYSVMDTNSINTYNFDNLYYGIKINRGSSAIESGVSNYFYTNINTNVIADYETTIESANLLGTQMPEWILFTNLPDNTEFDEDLYDNRYVQINDFSDYGNILYSPIAHNHDSEYANILHDHNNLYYTKDEVDTNLDNYLLENDFNTFGDLRYAQIGSENNPFDQNLNTDNNVMFDNLHVGRNNLTNQRDSKIIIGTYENDEEVNNGISPNFLSLISGNTSYGSSIFSNKSLSLQSYGQVYISGANNILEMLAGTTDWYVDEFNLFGDLNVNGNIYSSGALYLSQGMDIGYNALLREDLTVYKDLDINGVTELRDNVTISGITTLKDNLTLDANGTVFKNIYAPINNVANSTNPPNWDVFYMNYYFLDNTAGNENDAYISFQMQTDYKQNSDLNCYISWMPNSTNTGDVNFKLEYAWTNNNAVQSSTLTSITATQAGVGTAYTTQKLYLPNIVGSGKNIDSYFKAKLTRMSADASDNYTGYAFVNGLVCKYEANSLGSNTIDSKW